MILAPFVWQGSSDVQLDSSDVIEAARRSFSCSKTAPLTRALELAIENTMFSIAVH